MEARRGKSIFPEVATSPHSRWGLWEMGAVWELGKEGHLFCRGELCPRSRVSLSLALNFSLSPFSSPASTLRLGIWPHLLVCMALV